MQISHTAFDFVCFIKPDVQLCLAQIRSSWTSPKQWSPKNAGFGLVHVRSRRLRPMSHVTGHLAQNIDEKCVRLT